MRLSRPGCSRGLCMPKKAKLMLGMVNKTDKLDVRGFNRLQQSGTFVHAQELANSFGIVRDLCIISDFLKMFIPNNFL